MDALSIRAVKISWNEGTRRAGYVGGAPFEYFSSRNEKYFATPGDTGISKASAFGGAILLIHTGQRPV
jgi:hypothetical protein